MRKTADELMPHLQTYGPVMIGHDAWAHLDRAVFEASRMRHTPRLDIRGNRHLLGDSVERETVLELIDRLRPEWARRPVYP